MFGITIQKYLFRVKQELAYRVGKDITQEDLQAFDVYVKRLWGPSVFTERLTPAIFLHSREARLQGGVEDFVVSADVYSKAVDFMIGAGRLRHDVPVSAAIALDGEERVNRYICPAVTKIRSQLISGHLLYHLDQHIRREVAGGNQLAIDMLQQVSEMTEDEYIKASGAYWQRLQMEARKEDFEREYSVVRVDNKTDLESFADAVEKAGVIHEVMEYTQAGYDYSVPRRLFWDLVYTSKPREGDKILEMCAGDSIKDVIADNIVEVVSSSQAVAFNFNGRDVRLCKTRINRFMRACRDRVMDSEVPFGGSL